MSITFDPQFHTCIARHGARAVWLAAPLPPTLLPQKAELHRMWREEESRRLRQGGDVVLNGVASAAFSLAASEACA